MRSTAGSHSKSTRITAKSKNPIDHFITNYINRLTKTDMLPRPVISDYCAPYVCENADLNRDTNTSGMNVASLNRLNMPILKMKKAYQ